MKKLVLSLSIVCSTMFAQNSISDNQKCEIFFDNEVVIRDVETAVSSEKMAIGLSKREDVKNGMIFVFNNSQTLHFWMKDTLVDLSIGFFDKDGKLFQISKMKANTLDVHSSREPSGLALELKDGDFEKLGIKVGNSITNISCK